MNKVYVSYINGKFYIKNKQIPESNIRMLVYKNKVLNPSVLQFANQSNAFGGCETQ